MFVLYNNAIHLSIYLAIPDMQDDQYDDGQG
jgi:hypothetical protein